MRSSNFALRLVGAPWIRPSVRSRYCATVAAGAFLSACWPGGVLLAVAASALSFVVSAAAGTLAGLPHVLRMVMGATVVGVVLATTGKLVLGDAVL